MCSIKRRHLLSKPSKDAVIFCPTSAPAAWCPFLSFLIKLRITFGLPFFFLIKFSPDVFFNPASSKLAVYFPKIVFIYPTHPHIFGIQMLILWLLAKLGAMERVLLSLFLIEYAK